MTETQERFLRAVLTRVPLDSVVELHLFPPIRRGTLETGVAVIATEMPPAPVALVIDADRELTDSTAEREPALEESGQREEGIEADAGVEAALDENVQAAAVEPASEHPVTEAIDPGAEAADAPDAAALPTPSPRMRILTAAYRHTIKGVERGKWIVDVQEEADAPLDAVELVLRGVRHRSTEPADPELVGLDALAALTAASVVAPAA